MPVLDKDPASDIIFDETKPLPLSPSGLEIVYNDIYWDFIASVDANDNGISQYPVGTKELYYDGTSLSIRVGHLNTQWNESTNETIAYERFLKAVELAGNEFEDFVRYTLLTMYPASKLFQKAFENRFNFHPSGSILEINSPWEKQLNDLEEAEIKNGTPITPTIYYAISYDRLRKSYSVKAVSADYKSGSFDLRLAFPQSWRGLRNEELEKVCGIKGAVFTHINGFLAVNKTLEGAKRMAEASLKQLE